MVSLEKFLLEKVYYSSKDATQQIIQCNSNQFGYGLVHILTHLDKIFYRMDIALGIQLNTLRAMREILCHPIFRKCYYMQFRGENETLSNEDCEYLLQKTQPKFGITIFCKLSPDFNYKKVSPVKIAWKGEIMEYGFRRF